MALDRGKMRDRRHMECLLHGAAAEHGETGRAAVHDVLMVAVDGKRVGCERTRADVEYAGKQLAGGVDPEVQGLGYALLQGGDTSAAAAAYGAKAGLKGLEALAKNKMYNAAVKAQEKQNLKQLSPIEQLKQKKNPNAPKTNSEEYITYKLKQAKIDAGEDFIK